LNVALQYDVVLNPRDDAIHHFLRGRKRRRSQHKK
jgi:hypothetical protein